MESVDCLVVGAGVSGLSFANAWLSECARRQRDTSVLVVEADEEPGGYCKTVCQDGFTWDYSGHFFHFRRPEIEAWLIERMPEGQQVETVRRSSRIRYRKTDVDFPFQRNIHQLDKEEFIDCLYQLFLASQESDRTPARSFKEMLYQRFGAGIADRFLIPYNEKLYACDLDSLDVDAMGRFFPHASFEDVVRNMREPDNGGYNASFTYPSGGAIQYIHALTRDLPPATVSLRERLVEVDLASKVATTSRRQIAFQRLVSSAPFPALASMCAIAHDAAAFTSNKVLVFNLGFDRKGPQGVHWIYYPDPALVFYRVGFYDNILGGDRMSLYVEIGASSEARLEVTDLKRRVLADLAAVDVTGAAQLVSWHSVVLDPAYVHITGRSMQEHERATEILRSHDVYPVGRYGGWTYCSIEDNIIETRDLAARLSAGG